MEYRSVADVDRLTREWAGTLPRDLDLLVGISQGGMLVAGLLAWHLDLPVTDLQGLCEGRRDHSDEQARALTGMRKILVVDDRISTGDSFAQAKARIAAARLPHDIHYGAAIASPEGAQGGAVEYFAELVPTPWLFEWDVVDAPSSARTCVHFESVLAPAGPGLKSSALDGEIGWVVSSRPERRRLETETWLRNQGVRYRELVMECTDLAEACSGLGADLLVVYSASEASQIAHQAIHPVFSLEAGATVSSGDCLPERLSMRQPPRLVSEAEWWAELPARMANKLATMVSGASEPR